MSVVKEFLIFTVGLIITVSLAVISFNVYSEAAALGKGIAEREQSALNELEEYEMTRFDGSVIDGSRAISYIKKMYETRDVQIQVANGKKTFLIDRDSIEGLRKINSSFYMNPMEKYKVSVMLDENDAADRIIIELN